jgi:hypothetical protein
VNAVDQPLEGFAAAPRWRRALSVAVDAIMVVGWPLVLLVPSWILLVVSAFWVVPLLIMSVVGAALMGGARRQPNGDRLTSGQLLTGLTVMRGQADYRVVVAACAPEALRPNRSRRVTGAIAFGLTLTAVIGIWGTAAWLAMIIPTMQGT